MEDLCLLKHLRTQYHVEEAQIRVIAHIFPFRDMLGVGQSNPDSASMYNVFFSLVNGDVVEAPGERAAVRRK